MRSRTILFFLTGVIGAGCGGGSSGGSDSTGAAGGGGRAGTGTAGTSGPASSGGSFGSGGGTSSPTGGPVITGGSSGSMASGGSTRGTGGTDVGTGGAVAGGGGNPIPSGGTFAGGAGSTGSLGGVSGGAGGRGGGIGSAAADPACIEMVDAANAFLLALEAAKRTTTSIGWAGNDRLSFEFLPPSSAARGGLTLKGLTAAQRTAFETFLQKAMSMSGYTKTDRIRKLEIALGVPPMRDPDNYFVSFFGEPSATSTTPWGWRFEGHHLSLHTSVVACKTYSATPAFWGASGYTNAAGNPLATEEMLGQTLYNSLDAAGKVEAARGATGTTAIDNKTQKTAPYPVTAGIAASSLNAQQKATLRDLVNAYVSNMNAPIAAQRMKAIEDAGMDNLRFVFGTGGYFRVQGPTFVIVFAPDAANHIHSVWRDYNGDWGEDLLTRHLLLMHTPVAATDGTLPTAALHSHVQANGHVEAHAH